MAVSKSKTTKTKSVSKRVSKTKVNAKAKNQSVSRRIKTTTAKLFTVNGKSAGSIKLSKELFGTIINEELIAQSIRVYLANQRQGTSSTKTRGEVKGSRKKVWRQKGTGRARHGSITGPIFVGGGIVFGPKPRDFRLSMPKKMKRQALKSALSQKSLDDTIFVVSGVFTGKTNQITNIFKSMKTVDKKRRINSVLFVVDSKGGSARRGARNIRGVDVELSTNIAPYLISKNKYLVITKDAITEMEKLFLSL